MLKKRVEKTLATVIISFHDFLLRRRWIYLLVTVIRSLNEPKFFESLTQVNIGLGPTKPQSSHLRLETGRMISSNFKDHVDLGRSRIETVTEWGGRGRPSRDVNDQ